MPDQVTLKCATCGSDKFDLPNNPPRPGDVIKCAGCGAQNTYEALQRMAVDSAKQMVSDMFRDALKGVKGITFR